MATATRKAPAGETTEEKAPGRSFVVTSSIIVVQVGPKQGQTARFARGKILSEDVFKHSDVDKFLALKAIAVNDGEPKKATTAAIAARAAGAYADDPALPAIDKGATQDVTADPSERDEAPGIVHEEAEDDFEVRTR